MGRRERSAIVGAVLDALDRAASANETRLTRLALQVNMPYDRFVAYLEELRGQELVDGGEPPRLTAKGAELLRRYRAWVDALRLFGLEGPDRRTHGS